jgi:hypothetical protein
VRLNEGEIEGLGFYSQHIYVTSCRAKVGRGGF